MSTDLEKTEQLCSGEDCEFRHPARTEWRRGVVNRNGGSSYWSVWDVEERKSVDYLYIEHVRAPGTDPWFV